MANFVPQAFSSSVEHDCHICAARQRFEQAQDAASAALHGMLQCMLSNGKTDAETSRSTSAVIRSLVEMVADYRVSVNTNFCIWYAAEQHGKSRDVPELLHAYEEYRQHSMRSIRRFLRASGRLVSHVSKAACADSLRDQLEAFKSARKDLRSAERHYWVVVDAWTNKRRDESLKSA